MIVVVITIIGERCLSLKAHEAGGLLRYREGDLLLDLQGYNYSLLNTGGATGGSPEPQHYKDDGCDQQ